MRTLNRLRAAARNLSPVAALAWGAAMPAGVRADSSTGAALTVHRKPGPLPDGAVTADWPTFLGPTHDGVCPETKLSRRWPPAGPRLVWEMKRGEGYAAPSIVGDRLVFFHRLGNHETVDCLHPVTGKRAWRYRHETTYRDRYGFSNGPRASPVIDDDRVYVHGVGGMLVCLDLATGAVRWRKNTSDEFKVPQNYFGVGSTPLVDGDRLIVQVGAPGGPTVAALDKNTGDLLWQAGDKWAASYASPLIERIDGRQWLFMFAGGDSRPPTGGLMVIDPEDGRIAADYPFRSTTYESVNASNPVVVGNRVLISSSYDTGAAVLSVGENGGLEEYWKTADFGAHFATPIARDGFLYGITGMRSGDIALACLDVRRRKVLWREAPQWEESVPFRGEQQKMTFTVGLGSMIAADGAFLILSEDGMLVWAEMSPKGYREIRRARLFRARETYTGPVISRGLLYICQNRPDPDGKTPPRLLCYDLRGQP